VDTLVFKVGGMTCGGCVNSVRKVITAINGVSKVDVSLERGEATVIYDPAQSTQEAFKTAVRNAGFETG